MKKIAYLIEAHNDPIHLLRLINALNFNADFYIHLDKKTDMQFFDEIAKLPNVFFLSGDKRIKVYWAGFSQVKATLNLIEECLFHNYENKYKKVVLLSGACYPIKSNTYIHDFFDKNLDVNFIRGMDITNAPIDKYNYAICSYLFFDLEIINRLVTRIVRKFLYLIVKPFKRKKKYIEIDANVLNVFHGSSWWALNPDVLEYILDYSRENRNINNYFKYSMSSDEKYFHTIFFNSDYSKTNMYEGAEPFIPVTAAFANLHIIDPSLSKWFTLNDYEMIAHSEMLFVRKVSTQYSCELLDKIDKELLLVKG